MIKKRKTLQKEIVYNTVLSLHNHPSADEIFEKAKETHPQISRATVYRILNSLSEENKILHVPVPDRADSYDFNTAPHYHTVCKICNGVFDVDIPDFPSLDQLNGDYDGFNITGYTIIFEGICEDCKNNIKNKGE